MVLGLNYYESEQTVRSFGQQFGVTFPLLLDGPQYTEYRQPGGQSPFPLDYIVNRNGDVAYFNTEYDPVAMQSIVDSLVNPGTNVVDNPDVQLPVELEIIGNYPNPFNSGTRIRFFVPSAGYAEVTIYDILGRQVKDIFGGNVQRGEVIVNWSISDHEAEDVKSGIYFYRISFGDRSLSGKVLYLK